MGCSGLWKKHNFSWTPCIIFRRYPERQSPPYGRIIWLLTYHIQCKIVSLERPYPVWKIFPFGDIQSGRVSHRKYPEWQSLPCGLIRCDYPVSPKSVISPKILEAVSSVKSFHLDTCPELQSLPSGRFQAEKVFLPEISRVTEYPIGKIQSDKSALWPYPGMTSLEWNIQYKIVSLEAVSSVRKYPLKTYIPSDKVCPVAVSSYDWCVLSGRVIGLKS